MLDQDVSLTLRILGEEVLDQEMTVPATVGRLIHDALAETRKRSRVT